MGQSRRIGLLVTAPLLAVALLVSGCETKQQQGTIAGAAVGAGVGAFFGSGTGKVAAIAGGAVIGGITGNLIGKRLDEKDKAEAQKAMAEAETAPVGEKVAWNNPDSGNSGTVEVTQEGPDADGNTCREFKHTVRVGGETQEDKGVACKREDGKWVTVKYDE